MVNDAENFKQEDEKLRQRIEAKNILKILPTTKSSVDNEEIKKKLKKMILNL